MKEQIKQRVDRLKAFHASGATKPIPFRIAQLKKLKQTILSLQKEIEEALWKDLHKSPEEAFMTETSIVLQEIDCHVKHLRKWAKPQRVCSPIALFPSSSYIYTEPLGTALIIAPWNYPFQLILNPLIGAISAGCCAMMKPSPAAAHTANIVERIVRESFAPEHVDIVQGRRDVNALLLEQKYDFIFFTGSPELGQIVYRSAAEHLTPVILELGGKSPCIVDKDANVRIAARRIAWGKWLNAGQTCIAPDYLFVHSSVKDSLLSAIKQETESMYGKHIADSRFFPRIITDSAFDRLVGLMKGEDVYYGGETKKQERYISPTILDNITADSAIMQEEIFGPLLPVLCFEEMETVLSHVNSHAKPLALYYFGKQSEQILSQTSSGGACIDDTILHIANHKLPFGGVGKSGMQKYHGRESFLLFSNRRGVVKTPAWIDLPLRYPPFRFFKLIKHIL